MQNFTCLHIANTGLATTNQSTIFVLWQWIVRRLLYVWKILYTVISNLHGMETLDTDEHNSGLFS